MKNFKTVNDKLYLSYKDRFNNTNNNTYNTIIIKKIKKNKKTTSFKKKKNIFTNSFEPSLLLWTYHSTLTVLLWIKTQYEEVLTAFTNDLSEVELMKPFIKYYYHIKIHSADPWGKELVFVAEDDEGPSSPKGEGVAQADEANDA
ncbi:hypothetical protein BJ944DRAFT_228792 [Cunninghamella echinulata]|nr:hypothetical protein BJ944DRAFT_228792 [Cunninghamella echinulata]